MCQPAIVRAAASSEADGPSLLLRATALSRDTAAIQGSGVAEIAAAPVQGLRASTLWVPDSRRLMWRVRGVPVPPHRLGAGHAARKHSRRRPTAAAMSTSPDLVLPWPRACAWRRLHPGRIAAMLLAWLVAGPTQAQAPAAHHFGDLEAGLEWTLVEPDAAGVWSVHLDRDTGAGYRRWLTDTPLRSEHDGDSTGEDDGTLSGPAQIGGARDLLRLRVDAKSGALVFRDPDALQWPGQPSLRIAGAQPPLSTAQRLEDARVRLARADRRLQTKLHALQARLTAADRAALDLDQRRWQAWRDFAVVDGDDRARRGPGGVDFLREQARRTHLRHDYLAAWLSPNSARDGVAGHYRDGLGNLLDVVQAPGDPEALLYALAEGDTWLMRRGRTAPRLRAGRADAASAGQWETPAAATGDAADGAGGVLLLEQVGVPAQALQVSAASDDDLDGRFQRMGDVTPATAPMRALLLRLPLGAFDDTVEGLDEGERWSLVRDGVGHFFTLQQPRRDALRLRYAIGSVELRRFARHDGGAVVAVLTRNAQAHSLTLWQLDVEVGSQASAERIALPLLFAGDFFPHEADAPEVAPWRYRHALAAQADAIHVRLAPDGAERQPVVGIDWVWDGYGFGAVTVPLAD